MAGGGEDASPCSAFMAAPLVPCSRLTGAMAAGVDKTGGTGGVVGGATAAAIGRQRSHLASPLTHSAQRQHIPFGGIPHFDEMVKKMSLS